MADKQNSGRGFTSGFVMGGFVGSLVGYLLGHRSANPTEDDQFAMMLADLNESAKRFITEIKFTVERAFSEGRRAAKEAKKTSGSDINQEDLDLDNPNI